VDAFDAVGDFAGSSTSPLATWLLVEDWVTAVVQVQVRPEVSPDTSGTDLEAAAMSDPALVAVIAGREVCTGDRQP